MQQSDPISSLLFIAVMQDLCNEVDNKWQKLNQHRRSKQLGINITGANMQTMTNLRFAYDVILMGCSRKDIEMMLNAFAKHASVYGLKLNLEKTKVMTSNIYRKYGCQVRSRQATSRSH